MSTASDMGDAILEYAERLKRTKPKSPEERQLLLLLAGVAIAQEIERRDRELELARQLPEAPPRA